MLSGLLARVLRTDGYSVDVLDRADVPPPSKLAQYDVVLSDIHLAGGTNGLDVLRRCARRRTEVPVILVTAFADIEGAMSAVSQGAYDYLAKPIEPTELRRMVGEAVARRKLADADAKSIDPREAQAEAATIVGTAGAMLSVYKTVAQVAPTTATVLIVGESGTGKELVARAIHDKSPRAARPFVAVNCAALPESILESELFGHERGSFTGATGTKRGLFEEANGGTLFLDEIGEISPKMQVQLLRVLQEGEIRTASARARPSGVDVRVGAATQPRIPQDRARRRGAVREDLFFSGLQVVDRCGCRRCEQREAVAGHPAPRASPDGATRRAPRQAGAACGPRGHQGAIRVRTWTSRATFASCSHVVERAMGMLAREGW